MLRSYVKAQHVLKTQLSFLCEGSARFENAVEFTNNVSGISYNSLSDKPDVYTKAEVYSKAEVYNTTETYSKIEVNDHSKCKRK